jgi:predicted dehydrogenase
MLRQGGLGELRQIDVEYFQDWAMGVTDQGDKALWWLDITQNEPSFTVADIGSHAEH